MNDAILNNYQRWTERALRKIAMGFNMTVSELLDFPEMNEMESKTNERKYVR